MRTTFIQKLTHLAEYDTTIFLLTADMGFSVFEDFEKKFPDRFINAGIAEANMIGVAAGLAACGWQPVVYSIIPFVTMRCFEQIRNDVCYQNLPVKIVGVGGGFAYGSQGATHHAIEDIGILRTLPNLHIFCPADPVETTQLVELMFKTPAPTYLRLARNGEPPLHKQTIQLVAPEGIVLYEGNDLTLMVSGPLLQRAVTMYALLKKQNIHATIVSLPFLKPMPREQIIHYAKKTKKVITLEEHSIIGGLGSAVAEILISANLKLDYFEQIGIPDQYCHTIGSQDYLLDSCGLSVETLVKKLVAICHQQ